MLIDCEETGALALKLKEYYDNYAPKPMGLFYFVFDLGLVPSDKGISLENLLKLADIPLCYSTEMRRALLQEEYIKGKISECSSLTEFKNRYKI